MLKHSENTLFGNEILCAKDQYFNRFHQRYLIIMWKIMIYFTLIELSLLFKYINKMIEETKNNNTKTNFQDKNNVSHL